MRRSILTAVLLASSFSLASAYECPKDINPCKVMILTPQEHQWLSGTKEGSGGSVLDIATKSVGADGVYTISMLLRRAQMAQDGTTPKLDAAPPAPPAGAVPLRPQPGVPPVAPPAPSE